jgi:hypothetical protein
VLHVGAGRTRQRRANPAGELTSQSRRIGRPAEKGSTAPPAAVTLMRAPGGRRMSNISTASWLDIPPWLDEIAPGAADASRTISNDPNLTEAQRERLQRLVSETEPAWRELPMRRQKSKRELSENQVRNAQHELMWEGYRAADFTPIGKQEIEQAKRGLEEIAIAAAKLSRDISEAGNDSLLIGLWRAYQNNRRDDVVLQSLPDHLWDVATTLARVGDFFQRAVPFCKFEGPVPLVGQPGYQDALKTTVILKIASVCKKHFNSYLLSTMATLANASLNRKDITRSTVQGVLRSASRRTVD